MTDFGMTAVESRAGIAVETTEGTAMAEPTIELYIMEGNAPDIHKVDDNKIKMRAYNEPYKRNELLGFYHAEGDLPGLKFSPSNGIPEFLEVGFGNEWYSKPVYTLEVQSGGGATFSRGNKLFGKTSLARAEVLKVSTDTLYLTGVQGTFSDGEDLYNKPGGDDYGKNTAAASAQTTLSGFYSHKMDVVRYVSTAGVCKVNTTSAKACIGDTMQDFSEFGVSSGKRRVFVTVQDTATTPVHISGWLGAPCMYVAFKTGTATFTVGAKLSAKTGGGGAVVIGNVIALVTLTGTYGGGDAAGYLFVEQDATARAILDADVLTDNNGTPGAAVADMATIPAYLNNACKVYNAPDVTGPTQNWAGDTSTFDETDVLTYTGVQKVFDQKSLTTFVKNAGDATQIAVGTKVKEIGWEVTPDKYTYDVSLMARTLNYPATEPAYPGGITDSYPFGGLSRGFEIDGVSTGQASQVSKARFAASWEFQPMKGMSINAAYPTSLQPTGFSLTGTLELQWVNNAMMLSSWNNPTGTAPATGQKLTKKFFMSLDSGEAAITNHNKCLDVEVVGTIDASTLNKDASAYTQPVTIEGVMMDATALWGPARFILWDNVASH